MTAHQGFLSVLVSVFNDMNSQRPDLFRRITTAGAVCCRLIKKASGGCGGSWSNHAYGSAIDLLVDGILDAHGDNCIHNPLLEIAPFFTRRGLYWGAGFRSGRPTALQTQTPDRPTRKPQLGGRHAL